MHPLYKVALEAQARILTPRRWTKLQRLAEQGTAPVSVSFYHRVADSFPNDWTISRREFKRHLDYCQQQLELVSMAEVQARVKGGRSSSAALSISFDDGYRDNFDYAIPLLLERSIPCTYFVTTSNVRNQKPFQHDQQFGQALAVNTVAQIREMSDAGIEIGCHTRHHVDFSKVHDPAVVRSEVFDAKEDLEQMIGKPVRYFAFPFGLPQQLTQASITAVHEAGFEGFCSAFGAYNLVGRDHFHIRRFHGDPEFARLQKWMSFDERKARQEPIIRYFLPPALGFDETCSLESSSLCF